MRIAILIIFAALLFWLQSVLIVFNVKPVLLLVFLAVSMGRGSLNENLILAFIIGLLLDFFSPFPDGIFVLASISSVILMRPILENWIKQQNTLLILILATSLTTVLFFLLVYILNFVFGFWGDAAVFNFKQELVHFFQVLIFNIILVFPIFYTIRFIKSNVQSV